MFSSAIAAVLLTSSGLKLEEVYMPDSPGVMYRTSAALVLVGADFPGESAFQNSARDLRSTMVNDWKFPEQNVRVREVRTVEDASRELNWLVANTTEEDRVVVAFISHGVDSETGPQLDLALGSGRFLMDNASAAFTKIKARHKLLVLDACRSGGAAAGPASGLVTDGPEARSRRSSAILLTSDPGKDALIGATHTRFVATLLHESQRASKEAAKRATRGMWLNDIVPGEQMGFALFGSAERGASSQVLLDPVPIDRSAAIAGQEFVRFDPEQRAARERAIVRLRELMDSRSGVQMSDGEKAVRQLQLGIALSYEPDPTKRRQSLQEAVTILREIKGLPGQFRRDRNFALASAQTKLGALDGNRDMLEDAVEELRALVASSDRVSEPYAWAAVHHNLGLALVRLGEVARDSDDLRAAIASFRRASEVYTRRAGKLRWAATQIGLGASLQTLGEQLSQRQELEEAITTFRAVVNELDPNQSKELRIMVMLNLSTALRALGEREQGSGRLNEAVTICRLALREISRKDDPDMWASIHQVMATALSALGEREESAHWLHEAVIAYQEVLRIYTKESSPSEWASTQHNLGIVLQQLGRRESGISHFQAAIAAYRLALEVRTRKESPNDWAATHLALGNALAEMGSRESNTSTLAEASLAYSLALEIYTRDASPVRWAAIQLGLGNIFQELGELETSNERLQQSVNAYRAALEVYTRSESPSDWALAQNNLGNVLGTLGELEPGTAKLYEAANYYRAALSVQTRQGNPVLWAMIHYNLALLLVIIGDREADLEAYLQASSALRSTLEVFTRKHSARYWAMAHYQLGRLYFQMSKRQEPKMFLELARKSFLLAEEGYLQIRDEDAARNARKQIERVNNARGKGYFLF